MSLNFIKPLATSYFFYSNMSTPTVHDDVDDVEIQLVVPSLSLTPNEDKLKRLLAVSCPLDNFSVFNVL